MGAHGIAGPAAGQAPLDHARIWWVRSVPCAWWLLRDTSPLRWRSGFESRPVGNRGDRGDGSLDALDACSGKVLCLVIADGYFDPSMTERPARGIPVGACSGEH